MTRFAKRVDANHSEIRDGLRKLGYSILDLSGAGYGVPDIAVLIIPRKCLFIEIKDGQKVKSKQELTKAEEEWFRFNGHNTVVANSFEAAVAAINKFKGEQE